MTQWHVLVKTLVWSRSETPSVRNLIIIDCFYLNGIISVGCSTSNLMLFLCWTFRFGFFFQLFNGFILQCSVDNMVKMHFAGATTLITINIICTYRLKESRLFAIAYFCTNCYYLVPFCRSIPRIATKYIYTLKSNFTTRNISRYCSVS